MIALHEKKNERREKRKATERKLRYTDQVKFEKVVVHCYSGRGWVDWVVPRSMFLVYRALRTKGRESIPGDSYKTRAIDGTA